VSLAYAFGSAAAELVSLLNGGAPAPLSPLSDLDLGIVFSPPLKDQGAAPDELHAKLFLELVDLIPALDLMLLEETHSLFQVEAISGQCIYAASDELRHDYEMDVLRREADFRYHFKQYHRERREALG
jgi:hypothetical protein